MKTFHKIFYHFLRLIIVPYKALFTNYSWKMYRPKSKTYMVLANHNTNTDFFLVGVAFFRHMYFVASEHLYRLGFASVLIKFLQHPIPRKKGADAGDTVQMIKQRLAEGSNICMFVEGNRSYFGETGWISGTNGHLVKECGAGLITFATHGGYFKSPRWASEKRKGPTWGAVVHEYTPEELAGMTADEITEAIRRDLYVNAYEDKPAPYPCKHQAETLETALFVCPECHAISTLKSSGEHFCCTKCGMKLRLNRYNRFEADDGKPKFETIIDWGHWQQKYLEEQIRELPAGSCALLFSDDGLDLREVVEGKKTPPLCTGKLSMFADRLEFDGGEMKLIFPVKEIEKMSVAMVSTLLFTASGKYYEIKASGQPYSAIKYMMAWRFLNGKEYV